MLGNWRLHEEYQSYLLEKIFPFFKSDIDNVLQYADALSKLYILDLDPLKPLLAGYYSKTGTPAKNQPELIGSFILMCELRIHSITKWVKKLQANEILCFMIGLSRSEIHNVGSYYDLISRVWLSNSDTEYEFEHSLHSFKRKPRKKLEKNKKQPPRHPGIIQKFVDLALEGKTFESRPELLMQQIFAKIGVEPSSKEGLYGDTNKLHVSGDGTCVNSGGNSFGNKICNCRENDNYNCDCKRKFSDPYARWGWDSYHVTVSKELVFIKVAPVLLPIFSNSFLESLILLHMIAIDSYPAYLHSETSSIMADSSLVSSSVPMTLGALLFLSKLSISIFSFAKYELKLFISYEHLTLFFIKTVEHFFLFKIAFISVFANKSLAFGLEKLCTCQH